MTQYQGIFKRKEQKYRLNYQQYLAVLDVIGAHMEHDKFDRSTVTSVYFDSLDYEVIERSILKPKYKEKVRLRYYGNLDLGTSVFLEIKKKYKGIVYKRRIALPMVDACDLLMAIDQAKDAVIAVDKAKQFYVAYENSLLVNALNVDANEAKSAGKEVWKNTQIAGEIAATMKVYDNLGPAYAVRCNREAFRSKQSEINADPLVEELRITFDSNVEFRAMRYGMDNFCEDILSLQGASYERLEKLGTQDRIMEIKSIHNLPLWLASSLNDLGIYPDSFSKYGNVYQQAQESFASAYRVSA